jgi:hypothetical protein
MEQSLMKLFVRLHISVELQSTIEDVALGYFIAVASFLPSAPFLHSL